MPSSALVHIVDDDPSVLRALERLVRSEGMTARTYSSATEFLQAERPEATSSCLVLDVKMPGMTGLELQEALQARGESLPVVFITGVGDIPMSVRAMKQGAVDFLPKPFSAEQLLRVVRQALAADAAAREAVRQREELTARLHRLTPREREVMRLVVRGSMNKHMAAELGISEKTVKVHRARVMQKVGVGSLAELVQWCHKLGELG